MEGSRHFSYIYFEVNTVTPVICDFPQRTVFWLAACLYTSGVFSRVTRKTKIQRVEVKGRKGKTRDARLGLANRECLNCILKINVRLRSK